MDPVYIQFSTLVIALATGVTLLVTAQHLRIPAIVPLLLGGILLGPEVSGLIDPADLGNGLDLLVAGCVAVILFEGGLSLQRIGFEQAPKVIWRLLTIGVLITWLGTTILIHFLFNYSLSFCLLASSLIIVTGPTVIHPLLRRIGVNERLHHILHWEGVLIDPIGVFIAVLCFEWFSAGSLTLSALEGFGLRLLVGMGTGLVGGYLLLVAIKRHWIQREYTNIVALAWALLAFGVADGLVHEAGLLTVIIMGFMLGLSSSEEIKQLKQFKQELTEMSIAILFILLSAQLRLTDFKNFIFDNGIWLILGVVILIRPLGVIASSFSTDLGIRERCFLSWMAPRGIVAGSMASLFALKLEPSLGNQANFLQAFTFSIIGFTVIIQGLSAGKVANFLSVKSQDRVGWLIIGAHLLARRVASFIEQTTGHPCVLMDTNTESARQAESEGLRVLRGNALDQTGLPPELYPFIGNVLALTDNRDLNQLICERWAEVVGRKHVYRWSPDSARQEQLIGGLGQPIWNNLPKPTQIEYTLRNKDAVIAKANLRKLPTKLRRDTIPLILQLGKQIHLQPELPNDQEGSVLIFRQKARYLLFYTYPEQVIFPSATTLEELFDTMVENAKDRFPDLDVSEIVTELLSREKSFSTRLSHNVAIPHAYSADISEPICVIAIAPYGLQWESEEAIVRLVFLVISPKDDPEIHLNILAEIARISSEDSIVQELLRSETSQSFMEKLQKARTLLSD